MDGKRQVTVFGASGFLGRSVAARFAQSGWSVKAAARRPERIEQQEGLKALAVDLFDETSVADALSGSQMAVNAASLYREKGAQTFEAFHVRAASRAAALARDAGVSHFVQISGINAGRSSPSKYAQVRGRGEEAVREAFPEAVILRPSVIFGPGDSFFTLLANVCRSLPVVPLFGDGSTKLQPVFVEDIAQAVLRLADVAQPRGLYELGGPQIYSYRELIELTLARIGKRRFLMPLPFAVWEVIAFITSSLPAPPVTADAVRLMTEDNVVGSAVGTLADLDVTPTAVEAVLPSYLA